MIIIRNKDFMLSVAAFLQGSIVMTSFITNICGIEAWITTLIAILLSVLLALMYANISDMYPKMHLLQIGRSVCGKIFGDIISWFFLIFFLSIACFNSYSISSFFVGYVMPETPSAAFLLLFIFICSRAVKSGIDNIMKMSFFLFITISAFVIINFILLLSQMDVQNFLPLFVRGIKKYIQGTHTELMKPFGEIIVFLMFADLLEKKKIKSSLIGGLLLGGVLLFVIVIRSVAVLGVTITISSVPSYEVLRIINIRNTLTRVETFYSFILVAMSFFKVSVLYSAVVRGVSYLTGMKSEKGIVGAVGALMFCYASISFESGFDGIEWGTRYTAFFSTPFIVLLPLILFIVAKIKGGKEKCLSQ